MKNLLLIFLIIGLSVPVQSTPSISMGFMAIVEQSNEIEKKPNIRWDWISIGVGMLGLILTFVPYLSMLGLVLCIGAIVSGILGRRKELNKWLSNLGIILGSLGLAAFLVVLGLVLFF